MPNERESAGDGRQFQYREEAAATPDRDVLENVLRETLDALTREKITHEEIDALRRVAVRHAGQPLSLDPVTVEMVDVVVEARFAHLRSDPPFRNEVSREVASALHEAPVSLERLERLWARLAESCR